MVVGIEDVFHRFAGDALAIRQRELRAAGEVRVHHQQVAARVVLEKLDRSSSHIGQTRLFTFFFYLGRKREFVRRKRAE